jgi:cation transport protein ChaC
VAGGDRDKVLAYLRERELVTEVYREAWRDVRLLDAQKRAVSALCYMVVRSHVQYAGRLPPERLLELVRDSAGQSGRNAEYVVNTAAHLASLGIRDPVLEWLAAKLKEAT